MWKLGSRVNGGVGWKGISTLLPLAEIDPINGEGREENKAVEGSRKAHTWGDPCPVNQGMAKQIKGRSNGR